jgi:hypothetical protein
MFCDTCILFCDLFMSNFFGLGFFFIIKYRFFFVGIGLGPKLKMDHALSQCHPFVHLIWLGRTKNGSKWKCKVGICIIAYCAKWLFTKHLKEVHSLVEKRPNMGGFQLLKEVLDIKTMLKWTFSFWEMPWPCRGGMIKRLLVALMLKFNMSGMNW